MTNITTPEEAEEYLRYVSGNVKMICVTLNTVVFIEMGNCRDALKEAHIYRQNIKKAFQTAFKEYNDYENNLKFSIFFDPEYIDDESRRLYAEDFSRQDYLDYVEGFGHKYHIYIDSMLGVLRHKYYKAFNSRHLKNSKMMAMLATCYNMMEFSVASYEYIVDTMSRCSHVKKRALHSKFGVFSLGRVKSAWEIACEMIGSPKIELEDIERKDIDMTMRQIHEMMDDLQPYQQAIEDTIDDYDEVFRTKGMQKKAKRSVADIGREEDDDE